MAVRKRPDLPVALLQRRAAPPWTVAFLSRGHPDTLLDGFDPDPVLFARSVADTILNIEGLQDDPVKRYANASEQLREAVKALGSKNERDLHSLIESMPWILLPEGEFESFDSKKALVFEERLSDGGKQRSTIVPDFLYRQFEHDTLVVEIESGTKRLLTTKQQTNLSLPSAKAVASMFQILSYFRVLSGPMSVLPRQELDVPDDWAFRFLLVVGSRLQKDFDERSWMALRDYLHAAGIVLRTWDYYIDRLERLSRMADFKRS
jgi:Arc/MetJ-type ribon-helix-helix transcriptional regulator